MNLILTVLEIVTPVFALAAIGYVWMRMGFEYPIQFVTRMSMTFAVPCLIFVALMRTEIEPAALATRSLATCASYAMVVAASYLFLRVAGLDMRTYLAPLFGGNTGNLGLPLALFAFGDIGLGYAAVVFAIMALISFTFGVWIVSGGGSVRRAFQEPLLWAAVLGLAFLSFGWETPRVLTNTLQLIGQMGIPLMLITLGVAIASLRVAQLGGALGMSVVKAGICLPGAIGVGLYFDLPPVAFGVLVLQISTPVAVTSYMLAEKYGADSEAVAGLVVISTLLSVLLLPITLAFLL